jgi:DNA polymerase IV
VEQLESSADVPVQLSLDPRDENFRTAELASDAITARFGAAKIGPARLLKNTTAERSPRRQQGGSDS